MSEYEQTVKKKENQKQVEDFDTTVRSEFEETGQLESESIMVSTHDHN
jgi:hypothetical protein